MPRPTDTALRGRARALLEAMTERARWIYAVPRDLAEKFVTPILAEAHVARVEEDAAAKASRFSNDRETARFVVLDSPELDVALLEASGADAPEILAKVLDKTGFFAQSTLLGTALDVGDEETSQALRTLSHMVVVWDEDWIDLFLLHLASPDPVARHEAVLSLSVAAMVAGNVGPAAALLEEAVSREKFPKLRGTMNEALNLMRGLGGQPVELPTEE